MIYSTYVPNSSELCLDIPSLFSSSQKEEKIPTKTILLSLAYCNTLRDCSHRLDTDPFLIYIEVEEGEEEKERSP